MLTFREIQKATGAQCSTDDLDKKARRISIDSRTIQRGDVFIAVKGQKFDGHRFVAQAVANGAKAVVVSKSIKVSKGVCIFKVKDTTQALGDIAGFYRRKFNIPVIAVTGSVGKTTVKDMVGAVLSSKYKVLKSLRTENNQFGVPLTLLKLKASHEMAVIEIGTNHPGEIRTLTKITYPTIAILTAIGPSHLQGLKTVGGVFREKLDIVKYMSNSGTVIFNADDKYLSKLKLRRLSQKKITVSVDSKSDYQATACVLKNGRNLTFKVNNKSFSLSTAARHNLTNAIIAILCGRIFRISYNTINNKVKNFKSGDGRFCVLNRSGILIVDDSYNANPVSFAGAIKTLADMPVQRRRILVCADMKELGAKAQMLHKQIGLLAAQLKIDVVLGYGNLSKNIISSAKVSKSIQAVHYNTRDALHKKLKSICQKGDVVLVKGSRSMHMEQTVQFLSKTFSKVVS